MTALEKQVLMAIKKGSLFGSWLVCGPKGTGKKTFVRRLCAFLTCGDWDAELPEVHPDIKWVEKNYTEEEKKDIQKTILAGKEVDFADRKKKTEITVDDVREAISFLSLKSTGGYRILVINLAEDMNTNAANALLKVLEEPKTNNLILLLTENMGKLLPTIKSRCRRFLIEPMSDAQLKEILTKQFPRTNADKIIALAEGSVGKALLIAQRDGVSLYDEFVSLCVPLPQLSIENINAFSDSVLTDEDMFDLFKDFVFHFIRENALKKPDRASAISDIYFDLVHLFAAIDGLNLDKKQTIEQVFMKLSEVVL